MIIWLRHSEGILHHGEATCILMAINIHGYPFISSTRFLCDPLSPALVWCAFFCIFLADRKSCQPNNTDLGPHHEWHPPPPPPPLPSLDDPRRFISREVERLYQESVCIRSFILERGFPTSNAFFNFTILTKGW